MRDTNKELKELEERGRAFQEKIMKNMDTLELWKVLTDWRKGDTTHTKWMGEMLEEEIFRRLSI